MRRVPPPEMIEAFVTAMRAPTFRAAAESLAINPSAFGRRIRTLEAYLGTELFRRSGGRITATDAARTFLAQIEPSGIASHDAHRPKGLRILVTPSLASEWLMPRLAEGLFGTSPADYAVEVGAPDATLDPARHDLAILSCREGEAPQDSVRLVSIDGAVVTAPVLVDHRAPPAGPRDVADFDRLDMRFPEGLWRLWSERAGAPMPRDSLTSRFASMATMYEAAAAGFGVALAVPLIAERRLREGSLKPSFRGLTPLGFDFRVVYRDAAIRRRRDVQALVERLQEEAAASADEFRQLAA
jgi:LysR family glycine cleavage system transcriptional activator